MSAREAVHICETAPLPPDGPKVLEPQILTPRKLSAFLLKERTGLTHLPPTCNLTPSSPEGPSHSSLCPARLKKQRKYSQPMPRGQGQRGKEMSPGDNLLSALGAAAPSVELGSREPQTEECNSREPPRRCRGFLKEHSDCRNLHLMH